MGFFIKHIDNDRAMEFFTNAYTTILSEKELDKHKEQLMIIKEELPLFKNVKQSDFDEHIIAVALVWLDIAWTKYYVSKHIDLSQGIDFSTGFKQDIESKFPKLKKYETLCSLYNQAFGSSYTDGNTAMAKEFLNQLIDNFNEKSESNPKDINEITLFFSAQFVSIYDATLQNIKTYTPVH